MSSDKNITGVRRKIPNRMPSATFTLPIDGKRVVGIINYTITETGIVPMAFWVKLKPTDSYLDRELRASGKNMEDIIAGKQPDKKQRELSTDPYAMKE